MNHALAFPAAAGPHFTDLGGMEGRVGWLDSDMRDKFLAHLSPAQHTVSCVHKGLPPKHIQLILSNILLP